MNEGNDGIDTGGNADSANAAERSTTPGLNDRGEARQVRSKPSERGPLDALSGACRVVRRLSKHYAVREDLDLQAKHFWVRPAKLGDRVR